MIDGINMISDDLSKILRTNGVIKVLNLIYLVL